MNLITVLIVVILLVVLLGGGGWGYRSGYFAGNAGIYGGGLGAIIILLLVLWFLGVLR